LLKKDRKTVENNQRLLENRIQLLKQEERRTLRKIEETRKKALEIYYLKLKNEEKQKKVLPMSYSIERLREGRAKEEARGHGRAA
jgi:hypothetical protein